MIPKNKRHLIVNKEYSRLPYWTDDGYDDVQRQVSQKYVQDTYGKFAESENQLPYLSDMDYQGLEYQYQNPEYFDPADLPDVDFTDTVPKGTCYELWTSIFGHGTGAFIPSSSQWAAIKEYEKLCPVIYVPHICCLGMKISGPTTLTPGEEAYYSVSGGASGCAYEMKASGGTFVGTKYFAPMTPGTYELYVTPEMSNDRGDKCATLSVTVSGGCDGKIGYTTLQMSVGDSQTLIVTGSTGGTYTWATTSGSISPSKGTPVTFTAAATNANCSNNPTITLTCGGNVVDSIEIAINGANGYGVGYLCEITNVGSCSYEYYPPGVLNRIFWKWITITKWALQCNGTVTTSAYIGPIVGACYCKVPGGCCSCADAYRHAIWHTGDCYCITEDAFTGLWGDCRTAGDKAAGCCPSQLMGTVRACSYC